MHVPFCDGKCGYCAFYSVRYEPALADRWLNAVLIEYERMTSELGPVTPSTVYIGGGTPTLLSGRQLERLLGSMSLQAGGEWTMEANPGSVDADVLRRVRTFGVNRISLGVQSMDDRVLAVLGRRHGVSDVRRSVAAIREAGIENWGLDLIACVPGVTRSEWERTLTAALDLGPRHVSVYALTVEEGAALPRRIAEGTVMLLDDDEQLAMLDTAECVLERRGFRRYEISNYAQSGCECRHNVACWRGGNYLGLGCAASSRVAARRWTNRPDLDGYLHALERGVLPARDEEDLSPVMDASERLVFGLRMSDGVDLEAILNVTGLEATASALAWRNTLSRLGVAGLVEAGRDRWRLTRRGRELADHVAVELMP